MSEILISKTKKGDIEYELYESPESNPEIFVDAVQGIAIRGSTVRVNFVRDIINFISPDSKVQKRTVAFRLVMPITNYISVIEFLHENLQEMKELIEVKPEPDQKPT